MRNVSMLASVSLFLAACAEAQATDINPGLWTKPDKYDGTISLTINGADNFTMATDYTAVFDGKERKGSMTASYRRVGDCP
jgi:hypothetical protein